MALGPLELFYSYAHEDEALRNELEKHLKLLQRQGYITQWYDRQIPPGNVWAQEIDTHLKSASIILLLVSPDFIASDYCYSVEMQEALRRHVANEARVIPIILRPCDWEAAPFGKLQALPKDAKPVTKWSDRDSAFTDIAKRLRETIEEKNAVSSVPTNTVDATRKKKSRSGKGTGKSVTELLQDVPATPAPATKISASALKKAIDRYYKQLEEFKGKADYELAVRSAFQNLLAEAARLVKWTLIPEETLESGIRPDGVVRDDYFIRGYWEAKGPKSDLNREIEKKKADGYPLNNTIFENTRKAILYQNKKPLPVEYDLHKPNDVSDLLKQFITYTEPDIENFEAAVQEFKERIPELAKALLSIIEREHKLNKRFIAAFEKFAELCRTSLDPKISKETINEMLVQHLLTERLFRTVFDNPDFINRNVIAVEVEKVIQALASRSFNRHEFLKGLDRFYVAIEAAAKGIETWSERQRFLNTVYERFFQGFSVKQADTHGIVYTPQEIVDFMCASVEEVLQKEFSTSISEPGVQILDPAVGTGSFIVNLVHRIPRYRLKQKYQEDLFCNEITLLPYYIASLNIEHEYYEKMGEYEPFEGICFADTLELAEGQQLPLFVEENTERVQREKDAQIMVVIGNPPYNVGQRNENDNNKNRKYEVIDGRVRETYVKASEASNKNALSDIYVKFFRWATDRLGNRDGIVCFVSNNGFLNGIAFDGFRKSLLDDFDLIYHFDFKGDARTNGEVRRAEGGNIFDNKIRTGIGITLLVRSKHFQEKRIMYHCVGDYWSSKQKREYLSSFKQLSEVPWKPLIVDKNHNWLVKNLPPEFSSFLPIGMKEAKASPNLDNPVLFTTYSGGVKTNRDDWVYDFDKEKLEEKIKRFIETYNSDVDRWRRRGNNAVTIDDFVTYDDSKIKWSRDLKLDLHREHYVIYNKEKVRISLYRPFCKKYLFFDRLLNERVYLLFQIFPASATETENVMICVTGIGADCQTFMAANTIVDVKFGISGNSTIQCFPFYTYAEDRSNRRENITDWALKQFQAIYGPEVTKWDIFHYVYGMLHHPQYRERYAENFKRDLPHIPLLQRQKAFEACVQIGKKLMDLHLNYEQVKEYPALKWIETDGVPFSWRVEKMRLSTDKRVVVVNESLRLGPLPPECFEYRLGNRSALEWVIDQYQVTTDKRSGIVSDPNGWNDDEEYIVRLVRKVVTVSVETVRLVKELAQAVTMEDWLGESVGAEQTTA